MASPRPYSYEPPSAIRQTGHEATDNESIEEIHILTVMPIGCLDVLRYEALSYVWGDPAIKHAVEVDGKELLITTNLEAALRHLRRPNMTRIMWKDAICIEQDNIEERSALVQLMARIYLGASSVVIWLGMADADTNVTFNTAARIYDTIKEESKPAHLRPSQHRIGESHFTENQTDCYRKLFNDNSWSTRIWCVQEYVHARAIETVRGHRRFRGTPWGSLPLGRKIEDCQVLSNAEKQRFAGIQYHAGNLANS